MTVHDLIQKQLFTLVNEGSDTGREITRPFCCDLLSIAMSKAPEGCAWVSVMSNMNTLAVASLTDSACIVLAEDTAIDDLMLEKATEQGITLFSTPMPIFEAALAIYRELKL